MQTHSRYGHGMGNIMVALAPGDMIITAVSNGGTINIKNACEVSQLCLTHHAWTAIRHPIQANLQAVRHNIDSFVQVELEPVTGIVWHYQRRRQPSMRNVGSEVAAGSNERDTSVAGENTRQRRPNENSNLQTEVPPSTTGGALSGPLQQFRHVQWEQPNNNASSADDNPLVANAATEAAREALASFGEGAPAGMIHALATWSASHVRARRATRAPNHWCWSITTVCWPIARAMCHNGVDQGLCCRSMATRFGMNAAGVRQRPIASWEAEGTTCGYTFNPGALPPGAQSLGENERVVSHTNPRVSQVATTHLDRLVQIRWTELS